MSPQAKGPDQRQLADAAQYLGYGLTWALSTGLFLVGGWFVDRWLGTLPLFLITGAFVGAGAGFYSLYYHMVIAPRQRSEAGGGGARDLRAGDAAPGAAEERRPGRDAEAEEGP